MGWYDCLISEVVFCSLEPGSGELAEDLLAEGRVCLLEQIRKFDPKYGVEPAEYFVEVLELHLRKKQRQLVGGGFSASEKARLNLAKMQAERARLQSAGFEVNADVLAKNLNLSKEQVWDLLSLEGVVSYDAPLTLSNDEQEFFVEHLSDLSKDRSAVEMVTELVEIAQVLDPELAKAINCQLNGGDEMPADLALKARQLLLELNP
jgi:DNA-directed RNA polymerase specialized sigma subunit